MYTIHFGSGIPKNSCTCSDESDSDKPKYGKLIFTFRPKNLNINVPIITHLNVYFTVTTNSPRFHTRQQRSKWTDSLADSYRKMVTSWMKCQMMKTLIWYLHQISDNIHSALAATYSMHRVISCRNKFVHTENFVVIKLQYFIISIIYPRWNIDTLYESLTVAFSDPGKNTSERITFQEVPDRV